MANKKELIAIGAVAATLVGGYFLTESLTNEQVDEDSEEYSKHSIINDAIDRMKEDPFNYVDADEKINKTVIDENSGNETTTKKI